MTQNPKPAGNKSNLIIAILSLIVVAQSVKIIMDYNDKVEVREQLTHTEDELASTMQRLTDIKTELDDKIAQIQKLGGDVAELQKAKADVEAQLKRNGVRSAKQIKELKDKVSGYETLLKQKDEEIEHLEALNKELYSENRQLKTQKNVLNDSINRLAKNKSELASKVAIASQLKAENISVKAVNGRGKEKEPPFRSKQLEKLKVDFSLADNKVAPIEGKKILIRVVDENGQVIFDTTRGSGSFMLNGKEEWYTAAQEILFDNTRQKLSIIYEKGSPYPSGGYRLEIYTDGYLMGSSTFVVK
ncbi:MAG: chromosome segregation protein SMC [Cyclobacteriaceae bacterium]|nr:chromosome segregation protein SMC [Cyclobacteriaceae bacterium]